MANCETLTTVFENILSKKSQCNENFWKTFQSFDFISFSSFFFFFWKNFIFNDGLYYILDFLTLLLHTFAIFSRVLFSQNNEHSFLRSIYARLMTNRYYSLVVDFTTNKTENRYFLLFSSSLYTNLSRLVPRTRFNRGDYYLRKIRNRSCIFFMLEKIISNIFNS